MNKLTSKDYQNTTQHDYNVPCNFCGGRCKEDEIVDGPDVYICHKCAIWVFFRYLAKFEEKIYNKKPQMTGSEQSKVSIIYSEQLRRMYGDKDYGVYLGALDMLRQSAAGIRHFEPQPEIGQEK